MRLLAGERFSRDLLEQSFAHADAGDGKGTQVQITSQRKKRDCGDSHHVGTVAPHRIGLHAFARSEEHTSELQSPDHIVCRLLLETTKRKPGVEWDHSVEDAAAMVRDYIKWVHLPISLTHFADSTGRPFKIDMTPPCMPSLFVSEA